MPLVVTDILLHSYNIGLIRDVTNVLSNKLLDIHNRPEGNSLFHHAEDLLVVDIPFSQQVRTIFLLCVVELCSNTVLLFQSLSEIRIIQCIAIFNEAVLGDDSFVDEEMINICSVASAIKGHTCYKTSAFFIVEEFASNIAGKVLSSTRRWIVLIHICTQITIQCALRLFIGCLIKVSGFGFT